MDVRDSPRRPPRERQSKGRGRRTKFCGELARKWSQAPALPALPGLAGPSPSSGAPGPDEIAPLIPRPLPPADTFIYRLPPFKCSRSEHSLCEQGSFSPPASRARKCLRAHAWHT